MAGGKLSPRQKMINLMYLVFLAMIALNMGKQVLDAFGLVNQKFESSNKRANEGTSNALAELANKANENQAQYGEIYEQSKQIKELSDGLYSYIQDIKTKVEDVIGQKDIPVNQRNYQAMDQSDFTDNYFFASFSKIFDRFTQ